MVKLLTWLFKRKAKCSAQPKYIRPALRVKKIKRKPVKTWDEPRPRNNGDFPVELPD